MDETAVRVAASGGVADHKMQEHLYKVLVIGDFGVGMILQLLLNNLLASYCSPSYLQPLRATTTTLTPFRRVTGKVIRNSC